MTIPLFLLVLHFVADFMLQSNWMAVNKSKNWYALTAHVGVYSLAFTLFFGPLFGLVTFATHFATDALTSRWCRRLFPFVPSPHDAKTLYDFEGLDGRSRHWFFTVIGLDQLIHYTTLALTYNWLVS